MKRRTFDVIVGATGIVLAAILVVAGALLTWANHFIDHQVHSQLAAQRIYFPPAGSAATAAPQFAAMRKYAGEQLTTGAQAQTYADHFIAVHLQSIGGGKTYAELSAQSQANPSDAALAARADQMFKGEALRGLLLNAYAFGTMARIAWVAALVSFIGAFVLFDLGVLGLLHARRVPAGSELLDPVGSLARPQHAR